MSKNSTKVIGVCPDCDAEIRFRKAPHLGQLLTCGHCQTSLEVVRRDPLELDWAFEDPFDEEEEEDDFDEWDDEDDEDEDYDDYDDWDEDDY